MATYSSNNVSKAFTPPKSAPVASYQKAFSYVTPKITTPVASYNSYASYNSVPNTLSAANKGAATAQSTNIDPSSRSSGGSNPALSLAALVQKNVSTGTVQPLPVSTVVNASQIGTGTPTVSAPSAPSTAYNPNGVYANNVGLGLNPDGSTKEVATTGTKVTPEKTAQEAFNEYKASLEAPTSLVDAENRARKEAGLVEAQNEKIRVQNALNQETTKLNLDLQNLRGVGAKEGVTEAVYGQQAAEINREAMTRILPLQAQLALAQDNLQLATEHTEQLYKIYSQDAQNKIDFRNSLVKANYDFFTSEEKKKLDAKSKADDRNFTILTNYMTSTAAAAKEALSNGNISLYKTITSFVPPTDPTAPDFASKLATWQRNVNNAVTSSSPGISVGQVNPNTIAYAQSYADTGKLPSPAELKQSGLTVSQVTEYAKQLPRADGALVSKTTGVKQQGLSSTQEDGISALYDLTKKLQQAKDDFSSLSTGILPGLAKTVFYTQGQQKYDDLKSEIVDLLARARSGAALTKDEVETYTKKLPGRFNESFFLGSSGVDSINNLKNSIEGKLNTNLNTNNLALYGYSKIDVNGTQRTVGEILDIGGTKYRVLPDGNLTDQL